MSDKITVIEQTTAERQAELEQLYLDCLPYLHQGKSLRQAVKIVRNMKSPPPSNLAWFRDLKRYAFEQGYNGY